MYSFKLSSTMTSASTIYFQTYAVARPTVQLLYCPLQLSLELQSRQEINVLKIQLNIVEIKCILFWAGHLFMCLQPEVAL